MPKSRYQMKKKQRRVQFTLVSIGLLLFVLTYLYYPNINKDKLLKDQSVKKDFEEEGYSIIKNFYPKKKCNIFLKKIKKYANNDFAPIMNPDREEFLISQTINKILNFKYLGEKANFLSSIKNTI